MTASAAWTKRDARQWGRPRAAVIGTERERKGGEEGAGQTRWRRGGGGWEPLGGGGGGGRWRRWLEGRAAADTTAPRPTERGRSRLISARAEAGGSVGHGRRGQLCMHATAGRRQGPGGRRAVWPVGRADGRAGSRVGRGGRAVGSGGAGAPGGTGGTGGRTRGVHALRLRRAAPLSARRGRAESASSDAGLRAATPGHTTAPGGGALVWARRLARGRRPRVGIERRGAPPGGHPLYKPPLPTTRHPTGRCTGSPPLQTDQRMIHRVTNVGVRGGGGRARGGLSRDEGPDTRGAAIAASSVVSALVPPASAGGRPPPRTSAAGTPGRAPAAAAAAAAGCSAVVAPPRRGGDWASVDAPRRRGGRHGAAAPPSDRCGWRRGPERVNEHDGAARWHRPAGQRRTSVPDAQAGGGATGPARSRFSRRTGGRCTLHVRARRRGRGAAKRAATGGPPPLPHCRSPLRR